VTQRRNAEEALQASERRYRHLVEGASDVIYRADLSGRFVYFNSTATRLLGYEPSELLGKRYVDLIREDHRRRAQLFYRHQLARHVPNTYLEFPAIAKDGHEVWFGQNVMLIEEHGRAKAFEAVARDITVQRHARDELARTREELESRVRDRTAELELANDFLRREMEERRHAEEERRKLEAQVQHAQRLESLGILAGGIAHDFNNLLAGVMGYAGMAMDQVPASSNTRTCLEEVIRAARAAAELTQQMLAYSGRGKFVVEPVNLSRLTSELVRLMGTLITKKATLRLDLDPRLPLVRADAGQMRQVVLNLVTNASDALGESSGLIQIRTATVELAPGQVVGLGGGPLAPGIYAEVEVVDTGCGMDREMQSRIFDPFFTTKFTGRGLGLAAVLGIVRSHGGSIQVESERGRGTRFRVLLPACAGAEASSPTASKADPEWRGEGRVLVVDDEPAIRDLASQILSEAGFTVTTASDGDEAVRLFCEHSHEFRAVILDLTMPGMDGGEVYREMDRCRPGIPVVVCSGYGVQDMASRFAGNDPPAFLRKPYVPGELLAHIRDVLES
jgi:two-component system, cell cycle sensor histidine kinase and response regulator CckA